MWIFFLTLMVFISCTTLVFFLKYKDDKWKNSYLVSVLATHIITLSYIYNLIIKKDQVILEDVVPKLILTICGYTIITLAIVILKKK